MIPNTLLMMKALTKAVMNANTSRPVPNTSMMLLIESAVSVGDLLSGDHFGARWEDVGDRRLHRGGDRPSSAIWMSITSNSFGASNRVCAVGRVEQRRSLAPPNPSELREARQADDL